MSRGRRSMISPPPMFDGRTGGLMRPVCVDCVFAQDRAACGVEVFVEVRILGSGGSIVSCRLCVFTVASSFVRTLLVLEGGKGARFHRRHCLDHDGERRGSHLD
jgi:hypothetical protein